MTRWTACVCFIALSFVHLGCHSAIPQNPRIVFTTIPSASPGGDGRTEPIQGFVRGAGAGQKLVLFAKAGIWWVQPLASKPFTELTTDSRWSNETHLGTEYAALLVKPDYIPPLQLASMPQVGGEILAVSQVPGNGNPAILKPVTLYPAKKLEFSGFNWDVRNVPSDRGGLSNIFNPSNAWTDEQGRLHLQITRNGSHWECAEVMLPHGLGYGTYSIRIHEIRPLEPAAVLALYTWDTEAPLQNFREMDIEVSRWGYPLNKDVQFVVQPFTIPVNVIRFKAPKQVLEYSLRWRSGVAEFSAYDPSAKQVLANYSFSSGVPAPGSESVYLGLYAYRKPRYPLQHETEVIIDWFRYRP